MDQFKQSQIKEFVRLDNEKLRIENAIMKALE